MSKASKSATAMPSKAVSMAKRKRPRREVQVVSCPSGFPISTKTRNTSEVSEKKFHQRDERNQQRKRNKKLLDWHDTVKEVRSYGATAFVGKQKRNFQDEQYKQLTGRDKKKQKVPLPIVRGIRKKAVARETRQIAEAKEAGIVLSKQQLQPASKQRNKGSSSRFNVHGPAPSVGFMKRGVLRVKDKPK